MNFKDLLDSCQSIAISQRLWPNEEAIWNTYCREFSKRFSMSLVEVHKLSAEFVLTELFSDYFSEWNPEEDYEDILDMIKSLKDPEYDKIKEKALREELKRIEEDEKKRIEENRPVHESLVPKKFGEKSQEPPKELPKSGGLNFDVLRRLQNDGNEKSEF